MDDLRLPTWITNFNRPTTKSAVGNSSTSVGGPFRSAPWLQEDGHRNQSGGAQQQFYDPEAAGRHLIRLARGRRWDELLFLCRSSSQHMEALQPRLMHHQNFISLYQETVLGIVCSSNDITMVSSRPSRKETMLGIVGFLVRASPIQVRCSQCIPGHTPLRAALKNGSCPPEVVRLLLDTDADLSRKYGLLNPSSSYNGNYHQYQFHHSNSIPQPAIGQKDQDGLLPIDHIIKSIHLDTTSPKRALRLLEIFVESVRSEECHHQDAGGSTPLLRLLSLGTSYGLLPRPACRATASQPARRVAMGLSASMSSVDLSRMDRIVLCSRLLLKWNPSFVRHPSKATGCTPLHVAIRNYGNCSKLVRDLLEWDGDGIALSHRNRYGDLPIHVCSAVGVPLDVLRLVLERTLVAENKKGTSSKFSDCCRPSSLIWTKNYSGHTPIDLEWIRYIEAGNGFCSVRSFYPLDARSIRSPNNRHEEMYDMLLRQAVDEIIVTARRRNENKKVDLSTEMNKPFGLLLHRIYLIIRSAFQDSFARSSADLPGNILHLASGLSGPLGPNLPQPIVKLIGWQDPDAIRRKDHLGRLPLHCCFFFQQKMPSAPHSNDRQLKKTASTWKQAVRAILESEPSACRVLDDKGRIPLHYALHCDFTVSMSTRSIVQSTLATVVNDLLDAFPESITVYDPETGLYPFMLAGRNPHLSLDTAYRLLKSSPGAISLATANNTVNHKQYAT